MKITPSNEGRKQRINIARIFREQGNQTDNQQLK
jgi:hypothetical protein